MGTLVQQTSQTGGFFTSRTESFTACIPGSLMLLFGCVSENDGTTRTFDAPPGGGWAVMKAFRQTTSILNTICYGKYSVGGETSETLGYTASTARLQTAFMELQGYVLTGGAPETTSSAGSATNGLATDSGTCTPLAAGRLFVAWNNAKNVQTFTEVGGFTPLTTNGEGGAASAQKISSILCYSLSRAAASREQASYGTSATHASIGLMFAPQVPQRPNHIQSRSAWAGR